MKLWKKRLQRIGAMICAAALCASLTPTAAWAEPNDAGEAIVARAPENVATVYSDDEKGIEVTVETGAVVERTVNFVIVVDGEVVEDGIQVGNLPIGGTDVTILADRYKVSTSIDGGWDELGTFTHKSGNIYRLGPTSNDNTARLAQTSLRPADGLARAERCADDVCT